MPTYRYMPYTHQAKKTVECHECGKRMTRQRTFEETQNPFNVSKETGLVKTVPEIYASLKAKAAIWQEDVEGELCAKCEFPESA